MTWGASPGTGWTTRTGSPSTGWDLASEAATPLVEPGTHRYNIADVAPHPYVPEILLVVPQLDAAAWFECTELDFAGTALIDCPDVPAPFLLDRTSGSWTEVTWVDLPPSLVGTDGNWTRLDRSQLLYATAGAGVWRGTLTW